MNQSRQPQRGEIWWLKLHVDPLDKGPRPVIVISQNGRNLSPKANTVLVVPMTTTPPRASTHVLLSPGETGLEISSAKAEDITVVRKESLVEPRAQLRRIGEARLQQIVRAVMIAIGAHPQDPH